MPVNAIRVLFVCTHNSARSQIAEALLGHYGGEDFEVHSPGRWSRRSTRRRLRRSASRHRLEGKRSKAITEFLDQQFDYVITVCDRARATCPVFPGPSNSLHWGLDDPSEVEGQTRRRPRPSAGRRQISARLRPFIRSPLGGRSAPAVRHPGLGRTPPNSRGLRARLSSAAVAIANGLPPTSVALAFRLVITV